MQNHWSSLVIYKPFFALSHELLWLAYRYVLKLIRGEYERVANSGVFRTFHKFILLLAT